MRWPRVLLAADERFGPGGWWAFEAPREELQARTASEVPGLLARVDHATRIEGLWAVGFVTYEAAPGFEPRAAVWPPSPRVPLAWFALFEVPLPAEPPRSRSEFTPPELVADLDPAQHAAAIAAIHAAIERGDTYQANFTYRLRGRYRDSPAALFAHLVAAQRAPYSALLEHRDWAVASVSPELFFERIGDRVTCRPMKGTTRRGRTREEDRELARQLAASPKERAENVMIVDMVRNDLGVIARAGSVEVPRLFTVERFPTVSQMTSEVTARTEAALPDLFAALFPCASITGAPKLRTMEILAALESSPRGLYTGALGFVAPGGDCRFSVAIRTAWLDRPAETIEYGTGSGIVWDSRSAAELAETRVKARVLERAMPSFELLETLRWQPNRGFALLERHLARMADSADYFSRPFDRDGALETLERAVASDSAASRVVRLLLDDEGRFRATVAPLVAGPRRWRLALAARPIDPDDPFLFHKTTHRQRYDEAQAEHPAADEVLLWNPAGELTEGTRTNVAVELEGALWTPPVECGLLAGCLRAEALARGRLRERVIRCEELARARRIYVFNSLRGWKLGTMTE